VVRVTVDGNDISDDLIPEEEPGKEQQVEVWLGTKSRE